MRLDDLPESSNIEDRRQEGGGGFGGGMGGRGGLGIGTVVVLGLVGWALGIDPRLLIGGAEMLSGGGDQPQMQSPARPRTTGAPQDEMRRLRVAHPGQHRGRVEGHLRQGRQDLSAADAGHVQRPHRRALRRGARARWGRSIARSTRRSISIPRSSARSSPASKAASGQVLPVRAGLCDRPRGRPSRAESARHPAAGATAAAGRAGQGRRPTTCRSRSSCRPTASPASGPTIRSSNGSCWSRATWRRRCAPRRRSATTRCRSRRRATRCRIPSPTAPRRSASAGSTPASRAAPWAAATRSRRRSFERCEKRYLGFLSSRP